jgi:predicted nucleic acid-binding protein
MNLKIEDQHLTFKITQDELRTLLETKPLSIETSLLSITISPAGQGNVLQSTLSANLLTLVISPNILKELSEMGKNRDGITKQIGDLSITIQVDIRKEHHK